MATTYVLYRVRHLDAPLAPAAGNADSVKFKEEETPRMLSTSSLLIFRHTALGETYGRLGVTSLATPDGMRTLLPLRCERMHFAANRGICLRAERGVLTTYKAFVFGPEVKPLHEFSLNGAPSRVRVAPNGEVAAITVFVSGHSYAALGFSTQVLFVDLWSGKVLAENMESFTVWHNGKRFQAADFNFWGVTFAHDSNEFYVTLGTGGQIYLVKGDFHARAVQVLREGIECPSLSPDNSKVAFKKRSGGMLEPVTWRLAVLDLRTFREWLLAETRNVDDQVEWLDDQQVLYALPDEASSAAVTNTWVAQADGSGSPRLLIPQAYSAVVVRKETSLADDARPSS